MHGVPLDEDYSFELLRPDQAHAAATAAARMTVFVEQNNHWDMDAPCRITAIRQVADVTDPQPMGRVLESLSETEHRDDESLVPSCRPETTLYHILVQRKDGRAVGYALLRPCSTPDGRIHAVMCDYNRSGSVSLRSATAVLDAIRAVAEK